MTFQKGCVNILAKHFFIFRRACRSRRRRASSCRPWGTRARVEASSTWRGRGTWRRTLWTRKCQGPFPRATWLPEEHLRFGKKNMFLGRYDALSDCNICPSFLMACSVLSSGASADSFLWPGGTPFGVPRSFCHSHCAYSEGRGKRVCDGEEKCIQRTNMDDGGETNKNS